MIFISDIKIKNYRSCVFTRFTPNNSLSALIGPNGSGKTNILMAIKLLLGLMNEMLIWHEERTLTKPSELELTYNLDGKKIIQHLKLGIRTDERNRDEIIFSEEKWYMFDVIRRRKKINLPLVMFSPSYRSRYLFEPSDKSILFKKYRRYLGNIIEGDLTNEIVNVIEKIANFVMGLKYYGASQFTDPSKCPISFEAEGTGSHRRGIGIRGHQRLLYDMYDEYRKKTDGFEEFKSLIGSEGMNLVDTIEFREVKISKSEYIVSTGGRIQKRKLDNLLVIPSFKIGTMDLSPSQLSEGTFKTIALVFYLVTDKSTFLMIEEPEVCIHHGLLESIMELIRIYSKEKQIIITTHSDSVLDDLEISNIFRVNKDKKKGTTVSKIEKDLKGKDLRALKEFLHSEGTLGDYWKHGDLENV